MTDEIEPRLREHLQHRASRVPASPDVADLHHRLGARERRTSRSLAAALAVALLAGPIAGWAVARSTEPDRDTLALSGGQDDGGGGGGTSGDGQLTEEYTPQSGPAIDAGLHPVSARTTAEGIRLVVHSSDLEQANGPCFVDGVIRVGIVDRDLIDVVRFETAPGGASFLIAGTADARPMWVVVARGFEDVGATFPNGARDAVESTGGLAVLAAYASAGESPGELEDDVIQLGGTGMVDMADARDATIADGSGGCQGDPAVDPPVGPPIDLTMPEPGEPPADEDAARAEIEELFSGFGGQDPDEEMHKHERPNVWRDADTRFREEHPEYLEWAKESYLEPREIVFTAPDRATVRYEIMSDNPEIPSPGERLGEAVLIDGVWKVSIETSCADIGLAGIECDYSIEG